MIRPSGALLKVEGSKLVGEDISFVLAERANPTPKKPRLYLLRILTDGSRRYFSSCYPTTVHNVFDLEYGGIRYTLALQGNTAHVRPLQVGADGIACTSITMQSVINSGNGGSNTGQE